MKSANKSLAGCGLVFGLVAALVPIAAEAAPPPESYASSCVRVSDFGPGLVDAPTVLELELSFDGPVDEVRYAELRMVFQAMAEEGPRLTGEQLQARVAGQAGWSSFDDPSDADPCAADDPECEGVVYAARASLPESDLYGLEHVTVELSRTGGNPEPIDEVCLSVQYVSWGGFDDSPDVGPRPENRERDASEPGGGTVVDAFYPPGNDRGQTGEVPDAGLPPGGDWLDAGGSQHETRDQADAGSVDAPEEDAEMAQGCSTVSGGPAPLGVVALLLPLLGAASRRRGRRG